MSRKDQICSLLKGIETGDPRATDVVDPKKYVQHNPQTKEGGEGLAALFQRLSKTSPRVNIVRIFEDGDYVFGHTEYEFSTSRVGFEVFRFEGDYAVEHWDNIQPRRGPNSSGHSMVDGSSVAEDHEKTESNRLLVVSFLEDVLIKHDIASLERYLQAECFVEHNSRCSDGIDALRSELCIERKTGSLVIEYHRVHRVLAEGNFVLSVCEGNFDGTHSSFYDLFRLKNDKIVEHWDTKETVPPREDWLNTNGKF